MKKTINLVRALKNPVHAKKQIDKMHIVFLFIIMFISAILVGMTFFTYYQVESAEARIKYLKNEISKVESNIIYLNAYKPSFEFVKKYNLNVAEVLEFLNTFPTLTNEVFEAIDDNLLSGMTIEKFAIERSVITFKLSAAKMEDIVGYIQTLRAYKMFSAVDWGNSIKFDNSVFYCNMSITLKTGNV